MKSASHSTNTVAGILYSRRPHMVILKAIVVLLVIYKALSNLRLIIKSLISPFYFWKDMLQEYLLGRAVLSGVDPYQPLSELGSRFIGENPIPGGQTHLVSPHLSPHPPPVALFSLPLGKLSLQQASVAWLLLEFACLFTAIYLLMVGIKGKKKLMLTTLLTAVSLSWGPVRDDLVLGQWGFILLLLIVAVWLAYRNERTILSGVFLGLVLALKLFAAPILIYLLIKRKWKAVFAAGMVVLTTNFLAGLMIGFDRVWYYYTTVAGSIFPIYRAEERNISLWSVGWKLFEGTGSWLDGLHAPPLVDAPTVAPYVSVILPAAFLILGLYLAHKASSIDIALALLVPVSILTAPVAWSHYLVLLILPLAVLGERLAAQNWPTWKTLTLAAIILILWISRSRLHYLAMIFQGSNQIPEGNFTVPAVVSLIMLIPALAVIGLFWLAYLLEQPVHTRDNLTPVA